MKIRFFMLLPLFLLSLALEEKVHSDDSTAFIDEIIKSAFAYQASSDPPSQILNLSRVGETALNQALIEGDVELFRKTLTEALESPAYIFLRDWLTMTKQGDMIFHLFGKVLKSKRGEFAYELLRITGGSYFPDRG